MSLPFGIAVLFATAVLLLISGYWTLRRAGGMQRTGGLPAGRIVFADTGDWRPPDAPLFSNRHGLSGKPDYLVRTRQGTIPVELKSGAAPESPYGSHVLQLAAYCLLVEDCLGQPAPYGLIRYGDGVVYRVDFTRGLRRELLERMDGMRRMLRQRSGAGPKRNHDEPGRCAGCGYREICDRALYD